MNLVIIQDTAINPDQIIFVESEENSVVVYFTGYTLEFDVSLEEFVELMKNKGTLLLTEAA